MAEADSTAAPHHRQSQFRDVQVVDVLKALKFHSDKIMQQLEEVNAVAYGGKAHAGQLDTNGNPIDCTSHHIFNVITDIAGECGDLYQLQGAIAELTAREMIAQATAKKKAEATK